MVYKSSFASLTMFYMASEVADPRHAAQYWFLKLTFTTSAVLLGLAISAVLEEYAIARLAAKTVVRSSFYTSVIRANYVTLGLVLFVAAIQTLPRRLHSPGCVSNPDSEVHLKPWPAGPVHASDSLMNFLFAVHALRGW